MKHHARIARSGVQYYKYDELPGLGVLTIPREFQHLRVFGIYRSSNVLQDMQSMLENCPVKMGHEIWIDPSNAEAVTLGHAVGTKLTMCDDELTVSAELDIDDDKEDTFNQHKELSPGYVADYEWKPGISTQGEEFQLVCKRIRSINHIAVVPEARGGPEMRVLDGGKGMRKICSGLIRFLHKIVNKGTNDSINEANDPFILTLKEIQTQRHALSEQDFVEKANFLLSLIKDLPDSEPKQKFERFIMDVPLLRDEEDAVVDQAVQSLTDFYRSLDEDAISDVMETPMVTEPEKKTADQTPPAEEKKTADSQTSEPEKKTDDSTPAETPQQNDTPPETKDGEGDNPPKSASLDDVLGAIMALTAKIDTVLGAKDGCGTKDEEPKTADSEPKTEDEKPAEPEKKDEPETKTNDAMPLFTQTMNTINQGSELDELFNKMKRSR